MPKRKREEAYSTNANQGENLRHDFECENGHQFFDTKWRADFFSKVPNRNLAKDFEAVKTPVTGKGGHSV